jgi:hypothetical protein
VTRQLSGMVSFALTVRLAVPLGAQAPWPVDPKPVADIGGMNGGPDQELYQVLGARRLADGRIVVLNGKPLELRVYSAQGRLLKRIGRSGQGPGEFGFATRLISAAGDSIVTFTGGVRWQVFRIDGTLVREWTVDRVEQPRVTAYHRAVIRPAAMGISVCARTLIDHLPLPAAPGLRDVFEDGASRFWVHVLGDSNRWAVYSPAGAPIGEVMLPPSFGMYQVNGNFLVGRRLDADDLEHIAVYHVAIPAAAVFKPSAVCATRIDSLPAAVSPARSEDFKATMRNALTVEEATFARQRRYARNVDELRVNAPNHAHLFVPRTADTGYFIGEFDDDSPYFCVATAGALTPVGWGERTILCGN